MAAWEACEDGAGIAVLPGHVDHLLDRVPEKTMTLPEKALAPLLALQEQMLAPGDIWWIPEDLVKYPGGNDRFCMIVGLEHPPGEKTSVIHFVAGSRNKTTGKTIKVASGACGLNSDTYFRFWWSGTIAASALVERGNVRGSLPAGRVPEIEAAIRASNLIALKRFLP